MRVLLDLKLAGRRLRRAPLASALAITGLAVGCAGTVTVFTIVNSLLVRPPPGVPSAQRLVTLTPKALDGAGRVGDGFAAPLSLSELRSYQQAVRSLEELAAYQPVALDLDVGIETLRVAGHLVSANYFRTLGVAVSPGRGWSDEEASGGAVAVVSLELWKQRFAGMRLPPGEASLRLNGRPFHVVGVAPAGFRGIGQSQLADLFLPLQAADALVPSVQGRGIDDPRSRWLFWFLGRLRPGVDLRAARSEFHHLGERFRSASTAHLPAVELQPYRSIVIEPGKYAAVARPLSLLMALVLLLLLMICTNLAVFLLARSLARTQQLGVLSALGASRGALVRLELAEALLLGCSGALIGGGASLLVCGWLEGRDFGRLLPRLSGLVVDGRVVGFVLALVIGTSIAIGLVPGLHVARRRAPHTGTPPVSRGSQRLWSEVLVVMQISVCCAIVTGAALLSQSLKGMREVDPGFDPRQVINARLDLSNTGRDPVAGSAYFSDVLERVGSFPWVRSAALAQVVPLAARPSIGQIVEVSTDLDDKVEPGPQWILASSISPGYFRTLGIQILAGRDFSSADAPGAEPAAIVNEALAEAMWPGTSAVGRGIRLGDRSVSVVGVASGVNLRSLGEDRQPLLYLPLAQRYQPSVTLHLRMEGRAPSMAESLRREIAKVDPVAPVFQVGWYSDELESSLGQAQLLARSSVAFAIVALTTMVVGVYSVVSWLAVQRRKDLGIRAALGASPGRLLWTSLRPGLALTAAGLAAGSLLAAATARLIANLAFQPQALDPRMLLLAAAVVGCAGLCGSLVPARAVVAEDLVRALR